MATTKVDGRNIKQVLLEEEGWVEVRDFRATAANQSVDGVAIGASATFETREGRRTVPASSVLDVYVVSAEAEAEAELQRRAQQAATEARLFEWQHYTDEATYLALAEVQTAVVGSVRRTWSTLVSYTGSAQTKVLFSCVGTFTQDARRSRHGWDCRPMTTESKR